MPRPRNGAQAARWQLIKALTGQLARAQVVDTPETCALASRIKQDITEVYRAAGFPYPEVAPVYSDADARIALMIDQLVGMRAPFCQYTTAGGQSLVFEEQRLMLSQQRRLL